MTRPHAPGLAIRALNGSDGEFIPVTRNELEQMLRPLVGQKLDREYHRRDKLTANVHGRGHCFVAADIRRVNDEGIHCYFDCKCDVIAWADLDRVQFIYRDGAGNEIARGPSFEIADASLASFADSEGGRGHPLREWAA